MTVTTQQAAGKWQLDRIHSSVAFEIRHSGVSIFRGTFGDYDVSLDLGGEEPKLTGSVDVASVQVPDETLTGHLLAPDFFDAERYPKIEFASTGVRQHDDGSLAVEGDLTIKGQTQGVIASGRIDHVDADLTGGERYGVELETSIDRTGFGVSWNAELPGGGNYLENDVKLVVRLEFTPEQ
jgi:polyisoprenoid-binding protein YceI